MLLQIEETLDDPTDLSILLEEESEAKPWSVLRGTAPRVALRHLCSKFRCLSRGPATSKALAAFSVSGGRDSLLRGMRRHNAEHAAHNRRPHLPIPGCPLRVSYKSIPQECPTRVSHKSVLQECPTRVSYKSVAQECPTRVSYKSVPQECPTRMSDKSVP